MAVNTGEVHSASLLARLLLRDVDRIAERSAARMQELLASYAGVPSHELTPIVSANTRNVLEAIADSDADPTRAQDLYRASGESRARQGITSDELLHAWRIGLEVVRKEAYAVADELQISKDVLLEFVEATVRWGDIGMRASASAHHDAEIRQLGRLTREQAALRRVATMVARGCSPEEVFAKVAEEVGLLLGVEAAIMQRYEQGGYATAVGSWGNATPVGRRSELDGTSVTALVYRTERPARLDDYEGAAGSTAAEARKLGLASAVGAPIVVGGRLWGAIVAGTSRTEPMPADGESRIAEFTELVATAISNVQTRADVERLGEEQAALQRVATLVAQRAQPAEIFSAVSEEVGRLFGSDVAAVGRFDPDGSALALVGVATSLEGITVGSRWDVVDGMAAAAVYRTGRSARVDGVDWSAVRGRSAEPALRLGTASAVSSPIVVDGRLWGAMNVAAAKPLPLDAELRLEKFTELVGTAMADAESRAALRQLAEEQAALRRVATMVARGSSAEDVFVKVAEEIGRLLGAETAAVHRFGSDGVDTVVGSTGPMGDAFPIGRRLKLDGNSITDLVYQTARSARFDDSYQRSTGAIAEAARSLKLRSGVSSPIVVNGRVWGALGCATARAVPLPADAEARMAQFTELVATAISNVQARSDLAASRARIVAATDEERRRVVRDLHDGAQQRLVHTVISLKLAHRALQKEQENLPALLTEALGNAEQATVELRELAHGILPAVLTQGGLRAGVDALASRMPVPVENGVSVGRLPGAVEATAYFVVAEALTNVAKHSRAGRAKVVARVEDGTFRVEVRDDGVGGARPDGSGLIGLVDRLAVLDGRLRIESPADGGTLVAADIPVPDSNGD